MPWHVPAKPTTRSLSQSFPGVFKVRSGLSVHVAGGGGVIWEIPSPPAAPAGAAHQPASPCHGPGGRAAPPEQTPSPQRALCRCPEPRSPRKLRRAQPELPGEAHAWRKQGSPGRAWEHRRPPLSRLRFPAGISRREKWVTRGGRREPGRAAAASQDMIQQLQRSGLGRGRRAAAGAVRADLPSTLLGAHTGDVPGAESCPSQPLCCTGTGLVLLIALLGKLRQKVMCTRVAGEREGGCTAVGPPLVQPHCADQEKRAKLLAATFLWSGLRPGRCLCLVAEGLSMLSCSIPSPSLRSC